MNLYFVASRDGYNGENGDLFVWAPNPTAAIILWRNYYELDRSMTPDRVWNAPCKIPPQMGAVPWHTMERLS
jgi:hypothetical protein